MLHFVNDLATLGQRMRHFRVAAGLTLDQLGAEVGIAASQLSLMENGKREPRLSLLGAIADHLGIPVSELLDAAAPSERAGLEIELDRVQSSPVYAELGLPVLRPGKSMTDDTLRAIVGLHRELARRAREAIATPEEARRANTELRALMRTRDNHLPEIEDLAQREVDAVGHVSGALTHRSVGRMAERLGFELVYVSDLPHSARSVTDFENGRIYLPPASIPGGHGLRSMALQAIAHRLLEHTAPESYADFLQQRLEINYFAAAVLMPRRQSVEFLSAAKEDRNIAVEDFRDAFGVTHEAAALRFTNLATAHLGITTHFLRVDGAGSIAKAYENDGLPLPGRHHRLDRGRDRLPQLERPPGVRGHEPHHRVLPVHRHPAGHLLRVDPDRHRRQRRVLDHHRRAVRRTRNGSGGARPPAARRHGARMPRAAAVRPASSPITGPGARGPAPRCTPTSSRRCHPEPSPASTTGSSTSSWRRTRLADRRKYAASACSQR